MKPKSVLPQILAVSIGLMLLGGLGAYWPKWVGAISTNSPSSPETIVEDAITYQGYLTNQHDIPLNGSFTMRFVVFNDEIAGSTLWDSGNMSVTVKDGLFEVKLPINTDIFNGEALWISQIVNGEPLSPRQPIFPAPMAHTLRPGAIVKGTATGFPNNYALEVHLNNDVFAFNRGAISGQSTTGNAIYGLANSGRAIYGQTQDGYAIYGFDGGSEANRGYGGYFYSTNGVGVYGYSNGNRAHPNILAPGVYGQSNQGVGVYGRGDTSNSHSFYNQGGYFEGGKGLYARGTDPAEQQGYGAQIYSDSYRGMYVRGDTNWFDAYFGGDTGISANGVLDRSNSNKMLVFNSGETEIAPGDLVAMVGVTESAENGQPMLAVAKLDANNLTAVIGVAQEAVSATITSDENGAEYVDFTLLSGSIPPNSYLVIITDGLAPAVNVSSLALVANVSIGDKVSISTSGEMSLSSSLSDEIVVGKVAGPINDSTNTVPLFMDID